MVILEYHSKLPNDSGLQLSLTKSYKPWVVENKEAFRNSPEGLFKYV
jgi:hypothetical protein